MKKEDIPFLVQLVDALEEAGIVLDLSIKYGNQEKFDEAKKFILGVKTMIDEVVS